jgi:hypothetical protein
MLALLLVLATPAPGLQLDWQAPAGCPDQAGVRGRVAAMLAAGAVEGSDLAATGRVSAAGEGWQLELELVRAGGARAADAGRPRLRGAGRRGGADDRGGD